MNWLFGYIAGQQIGAMQAESATRAAVEAAKRELEREKRAMREERVLETPWPPLPLDLTWNLMVASRRRQGIVSPERSGPPPRGST